MKKITIRHIKLILATILLGIAVPLCLYKISYSFNIVNNGFTRRFTPPALTLKLAVDKPAYIYGIARSTNLVNNTVEFVHLLPGKTASLNLTSGRFSVDSLVGWTGPVLHDAYDVQMDSARMFIFFNNRKKIYVANRASKKVIDSLSVPIIFTRAAIISPGSVGIREFRAGRNLEQGFAKGQLSTKAVTHATDNTPQHAGISADGLLHFDATTARLLYVPSYAGTISSFDTNFNIKGAFHTLDTITVNQTLDGKTQVSANTIKVTTVSPRYPITFSSSASRGKLYLLSGVRSDNQTMQSIREEGTVDVYNISTGTYLHSFTIPPYKTEKATDIEIVDNLLVVLYDHYIAIFQLPG